MWCFVSRKPTWPCQLDLHGPASSCWQGHKDNLVESGDDEITDLTVDYDDDRHMKRVQAEVSAYDRALRLRLSARDDRVKKMAGGKSGGDCSNFNSSRR